MIGLLQRVTRASVEVDDGVIASIEQGILVLVGICKQDNHTAAERLLERLLGYRVFPDDQGKMNLSVRDIEGGLLLVPQFTLAADTRKGTRASFTSGASPDQARELFEYLCACAAEHYSSATFGRFAADMKVNLVNDGPVTFWLES